MLFRVDPETVDLMQPARTLEVFESVRNYAYVVVLNVRHPFLQHASVRQALNAAVDRRSLVAEALHGRGVPFDSAVWPRHWARGARQATFRYDPAFAAEVVGASRGRGDQSVRGGDAGPAFVCTVPESVPERLVLALQQQLRAIGVEMGAEVVTLQEFGRRFPTGRFDAAVLPILIGPNLLRQYLWWHSVGPYNFGGFRSPRVDAGLDAIRHAADTADYERGVGAFLGALVEDPPAIFLAWTTESQAVSKLFTVVPNPGGDLLKTIRLWQPNAPVGPSEDH
jgi:ABC-type transport system substrate-binding protein